MNNVTLALRIVDKVKYYPPNNPQKKFIKC